MRPFLHALSFLTILPMGGNTITEDRELARSMAFFPVVGLLIGLILCPGYYLLSLFFLKPLVIWLTIGLLVFLTRGLHLDGFADTMDGLSSGGSRENILEVMRDSRIGAFGVMSLIFLIGAKYFALDQIPNSSFYPSLILMTVLGRNSMVLVCYRSPYARSGEGLGKPFSENLHFREMAVSLILTFGIALLLTGTKGILVFLGVGLFSMGYRFFFIKRLGGVTGDILGGANEISELLTLLLLIIKIGR
ncbi:MAG: adenosylcobinamide-GDP ribazoletransferase [Deltaproteobacteria bacterium]|nr:adenosylcobinamide-GDP ribazoletransferase [Deltaproteobacteria bacterium]